MRFLFVPLLTVPTSRSLRSGFRIWWRGKWETSRSVDRQAAVVTRFSQFRFSTPKNGKLISDTGNYCLLSTEVRTSDGGTIDLPSSSGLFTIARAPRLAHSVRAFWCYSTVWPTDVPGNGAYARENILLMVTVNHLRTRESVVGGRRALRL